MKHLIGSEANRDDLVVHSDCVRDRLMSNYSNKVSSYCKKMKHIKKDYYKLQNKDKSVATNQKEK